jgi:hypothetical protein
MKREPRFERLAAASRSLRRRMKELEPAELAELRDLLERLLEREVLDRDAIRELEERLLR